MESIEFEKMIFGLDVRVFEKISSQTTGSDRRSLLFLQREVRGANPSYVYLEIGSHLGGSIQPYLLDRKCSKIYSIDKRSTSQPDERCEEDLGYPGNTTERMLQNLRSITGDVSRVVCIDGDVSSIDMAQVDQSPDICLIDGEHTNKAVIRDFNFCKLVLNEDGLIVFHDANVVAAGLKKIVRGLKESGERFGSCYFSTSIFVLVFGAKYDDLKKLRLRSFAAKVKMMLSGMLPEPVRVAILRLVRRHH